MKMFETDGASNPSTESGPAPAPRTKKPPRSSAPGSPVVAAPAQHWSSPVGLTPALHVPHAVDCGTQSATHSKRLPTMSNAPSADLQLAREPVLTAVKGT